MEKVIYQFEARNQCRCSLNVFVNLKKEVPVPIEVPTSLVEMDRFKVTPVLVRDNVSTVNGFREVRILFGCSIVSLLYFRQVV